MYATTAYWLGYNANGQPQVQCSTPLITNMATMTGPPGFLAYNVYVTNTALSGLAYHALFTTPTTIATGTTGLAAAVALLQATSSQLIIYSFPPRLVLILNIIYL